MIETARESLFTVVGRAGSYEARVLDGLAQAGVCAGHRVGADVALRTLEARADGARELATQPPLVFLHGRGHAAVLWAPLLDAFARSRSVLALDLPGFGRSGAPPVRGRGLDYFSAPIEAAISSGPPPVLIGHSLGGYVALRIALDRRVPLAGLVLVDAMGIAETIPVAARAYLGFGPERLAKLRALGQRAPRGSEPIRWAHDDEADAARVAPLRAELLASPGTRDRASAAFDAAMRTHVRDRLAEVDVPTLLLWGTRDATFPLPHAIHAATQIRGAELVRVDAGHSPHLERPATVARALAAWLERRARP